MSNIKKINMLKVIVLITIFLASILLFLYLTNMDKINSNPIKNSTKCSTDSYKDIIDYSRVTCDINYGEGENYRFSYIKIHSNIKAVVDFNKIIAGNHNSIMDNLKIVKDEKLGKIISIPKKIDYDVTSANGIFNVLVNSTNYFHNNIVESSVLKNYNINSSGQFISNEEVFKIFDYNVEKMNARLADFMTMLYFDEFNYHQYKEDFKTRNGRVDEYIRNFNISKIDSISFLNNNIIGIIKTPDPKIINTYKIFYIKFSGDNIEYSDAKYK